MRDFYHIDYHGNEIQIDDLVMLPSGLHAIVLRIERLFIIYKYIDNSIMVFPKIGSIEASPSRKLQKIDKKQYFFRKLTQVN